MNFDQKYPNAAVHDDHTVPACFTRQGWAAMQDLLNRPASLKTDDWVLGQSSVSAPEELSRRVEGYRSRYATDYKEAWKKFLDFRLALPYANYEDGATKLEKMSDQHSYLLNLIGLAAEHTGSIEAMKASFSPRRGRPGDGAFQPASEYLTRLASSRINCLVLLSPVPPTIKMCRTFETLSPTPWTAPTGFHVPSGGIRTRL